MADRQSQIFETFVVDYQGYQGAVCGICISNAVLLEHIDIRQWN